RVSSFLRESVNLPDVTAQYLKKIYFQDFESKEFVRDFMRADIRSWLPDESLVRSDKMSMAASVETRVPFLDHRLVEFADRIPVKWKLGTKGFGFTNVGRNYEGKRILKEAMADY